MKARTSAAAATATALAACSFLPTPTLGDAPPNPNAVKMYVGGPEADTGRRGLQSEQERFLEVTLQGNAEYSWYETVSGHTVRASKTDGEAHYLDVDDKTGALYETDCIVGECNPDVFGIEPHAVDDEEQILFMAGPAARRDRRLRINRAIKRMKDRKRASRNKQTPTAGGADKDDLERRQRKLRGGATQPQLASSPGSIYSAASRDLYVSGGSDYADMTMNNLVLLIRWADHKHRKLPSKEDMEVLFNKVGGDDVLAPTGSVRDCFLFNSYNSFDMVSHVTRWIDLPYEEKEIGDAYYGMTGKVGMAIRHALDEVKDEIDWSLFDQDGDGEIDAIAVIHSGFGAEAAEPDCYTKVEPLNRIWSHKWNLDEYWYSPSTNMLIWKYHISPALWGSCGGNIGRIGVVCHETGHFLGAPDMYDGTGGNGAGSYALMGNSWGFSGSQFDPPMMSPWSKIMLGWMNPNIITSSGQYNAIASFQGSGNGFVIANPDKKTEYFIIENRVKTPNKFDANLPAEGLLIWHIDDEADFNQEGHPGLIGWPQSGDHYRVAVVQADGQFQLETAASRGDSGDLFYKGGAADEIGPDGVKKDGVLVSKQPNTHWYADGDVKPSSIRIYDIGYPGHTVSFKVEIEGQGGSSIDDVGEIESDGPVKSECGSNGARCSSSDECCSRHTCKPTNGRGKKKGKPCCKLTRKRNKKRNSKRNRAKNKMAEGNRALETKKNKRRITPLN